MLEPIKLLEDNYLRRHHSGVCLYASLITRIICPELINIVSTAALYHDIGKIKIPAKILTKSGDLNLLEWELIYAHPEIGASIMLKMGYEKNIYAAIKHHHERWDGEGYPDGLKGEDIPLPSRIIAVADTFDAMTTNRPYKKAKSKDLALKELSQNTGQHDPDIVKILFKII